MKSNTNTEYHVTGVTVNGSRFKIVTHNFFHAMSINLWCGTVWEVVAPNKRKKIKEVWN